MFPFELLFAVGWIECGKLKTKMGTNTHASVCQQSTIGWMIQCWLCHFPHFKNHIILAVWNWLIMILLLVFHVMNTNGPKWWKQKSFVSDASVNITNKYVGAKRIIAGGFEAKLLCFYFNFCSQQNNQNEKKAIISIWTLFAVIAMNSESIYNVNDSSLIVVSYLLVRLFIIEIHLLQLLLILCDYVCVCMWFVLLFQFSQRMHCHIEHILHNFQFQWFFSTTFWHNSFDLYQW